MAAPHPATIEPTSPPASRTCASCTRCCKAWRPRPSRSSSGGWQESLEQFAALVEPEIPG